MRFLRLACNFRKYSEPRFAISLPPFRPRATAAGSFFFANVRERGYNDVMPYRKDSPNPRDRSIGFVPVLNHRQTNSS